MDERQNLGITLCDENIDVTKECRELKLNNAQKIQMGGLMSQLPLAAVTGEMSQLYKVSFPNGGTVDNLMRYKTGGLSSVVRGDDGKIATHAEFNTVNTQAVVMGLFTIISIASSQYFLKQIGNELKMMRLSIDKILEFLYGDKKAELMSEVNFVKYAYQNYSSIMSHEQQRIATIESLHNSKKVAMKDIEFYVNDLRSAVTTKVNDIDEINKIFQIKDSLELSMQLYGMSSLLEVYYSQNYDKEYLKYIEHDIAMYFDKCEKRMLSSFAALNGMIGNAKGFLGKKIISADIIKEIDEFIEVLTKGEESEIKKTIKSSLSSVMQEPTYYIKSDGSVYLKKHDAVHA